MERDHRTLWKWDHREIRQVFCPRKNGLFACPLSNYCRWNVFLESNNNWSTSSFSIDECVRLVKTMISRDLSSDASYCNRINLHDVSQETNHVTLLHSQRNRSSSSRWILIHWMFPSTLLGRRYHDQKRRGHDRNICHNADETLKAFQQVYYCLCCLVIVKITCYCHVWSEIVVTNHTDT